MKWSEENWEALLENLGLQSDHKGYFGKLEKLYNSRSRYYHNTQHIEDCLTLLEEHHHLAYAPKLIEAAIWLHDAIYNSLSKKNELKSAELAKKIYSTLGMKSDSMKAIYDLIMITAHQKEPETKDEKLIVDIDLSILGASPERYNQYEKNIRKEYRLIPSKMYVPGRIKVLEHFLSRKKIYSLPEFQERYEKQARENLKLAIDRLK